MGDFRTPVPREFSDDDVSLPRIPGKGQTPFVIGLTGAREKTPARRRAAACSIRGFAKLQSKQANRRPSQS